jgi:hypothetical protein
MSGITDRLLMIEKVVEREEGARRLAGFLDDKIGCQQAAVRRTRARRQKKATMGGGGRCIHEKVSQATAFVYREGVCNVAAQCRNELLRRCDMPTIDLECSGILESTL